jgi:CBS domain containing-hemolysin-like protein
MTKKTKIKEVVTSYQNTIPLITDWKADKISDLLELLNNSERNFSFWADKNKLGDIMGIVPIERIIKEKIGSIYYEYEKETKDICAKLFIIDIVEQSNDDYKNEEAYLKKKKIIENQHMIYIKNADINFIFNQVLITE